MHLLRIESRSIDDIVEAVDLGQSPAEIVILSSADTTLASLAAAEVIKYLGARPLTKLTELLKLL